MEQWEIDLREKLDKELPQGWYTIEAGGTTISTGKQGQIEFEVAFQHEIRRRGLIIEKPRKSGKVQAANQYKKFTEDRLRQVIADTFKYFQ